MIYHFVAEQTDANLDFDITLEKDKLVYCFIGENAVGKTNLLENMARSLFFHHSMFSAKNNNRSNQYSGIYFRGKINDGIKEYRFRVAQGITLNEKLIKNKSENNWTIINLEKLGEILNIFPKTKFYFDKPIVFIGAKGRGYTRNINKDLLKILGDREDRFLEIFSRTFHYMNGSSVDETEVADWFNSRLIINPRFVLHNQNRIFEVVLVLELMQKLDPNLKLIQMAPDSEGRESVTGLNIFFAEGKLFINGIPIDKLSTGYVSIIKIFQEIVAAYGGWSGMISDHETDLINTDLRNIEGVVFIDEIESHLHPQWQYQIIPLLKEFFPKTTFYIATHSPLIVSTTEAGEAYELVREGNRVTAQLLGNPKEWYFTSILTQAFHVNFVQAKKNNAILDSINQFKDFSAKIENYVNNRDENLRLEIEEMYQSILSTLAADDPRRHSLDALKSLMK